MKPREIDATDYGPVRRPRLYRSTLDFGRSKQPKRKEAQFPYRPPMVAETAHQEVISKTLGEGVTKVAKDGPLKTVLRYRSSLGSAPTPEEGSV